MENCPIKRKTSDLRSTERKAPGKPKYLSPAEFARLIGPLKGKAGRKRINCSERTVREWCKKGLIPEASKTNGGHFHIRMPLSIETRYRLEKRMANSPLRGVTKSKDIVALFASDLAEWLTLALIYGRKISKSVGLATIAELPDQLQSGIIERPVGKKAKLARKIQDEILSRIEKKQPFWEMLLSGWVHQFYRETKRRPSVAQIAERMGISRDTYYRRFGRYDLKRTYARISNEFEIDLPDQDGLDSTQRANKQAKKKNFIGDWKADRF